ncbi:serine hydrolase domain-containing protein [Catenulispora yoronensis]
MPTDSPGPPDVHVGDVQKAMDVLARADGVVGALGEVYVDGRRVGHSASGSRLLRGEGGTPSSDARFRLGSQTKAMVATTVLKLVAEGRLGVSDKLATLLPEVARQDMVEHADEITVRNLIRHTSGIPDFIPSGWFDPFDFHTYHPPLDLIRASRTQPRDGNVGGFFYSTTNYILLGLIAERVTRRPLPEILAEKLFTPLGMTRTYLPTRPPQGISGVHAHGYFPDATGRLHDMDRINASTWAVQSAVSTCHDVSAFQRAFDLGTLLPADLQEILLHLGRPDDAPGAPSGPPPAQGGQLPPAQGGQLPPALCGNGPALRPAAGSIPGLNAVTYSSPDGRIQFAVSVTLDVDNMAFHGEPVDQAAQAVLCA